MDGLTPQDYVLVQWLDAKIPQPGWEDLATLAPLEPLRCASVGFVLAEDDQTIVLAQTVGEVEVQGRLAIPAGAVTKIFRLKAGRGRRPGV